ncbi:MAG: hypothetical protein ACYSX1_09740, partial [Planctomycetota bacterium]
MEVATKGKFTFGGGVHPFGGEKLARDCEVKPGPTAKQVAIMLSQHTGAACQPLVKKGDLVEAGQKIGDSDAFVSAPVHSPVKGKVKGISLASHAVLGRSMAVVIDVDAEGNPPKEPPDLEEDIDVEKCSAEQICNAVREAGIVGMGGAGFPTRVKIEPNPRLPKDTMIINGCECEPCITCDYRLMLERPKQIVAG